MYEPLHVGCKNSMQQVRYSVCIYVVVGSAAISRDSELYETIIIQ
jgi:hypothetical protein